MAETTRSSVFSANFHGFTSDESSQRPSLATASTSDIFELASALSSAADAQTAKITALMAVMMDQQLLENNINAQRNNPQKEVNQHRKSNNRPKSYCWTHGVTRKMDHNSGTCDYQHTDHQKKAMNYSRMVGSYLTCGYRQRHSTPGPAN